MDLTMFQLKLLILGLRFEAKTGMLMTSPTKVNSAKMAKEFLGIPIKKRIPKADLADMLQKVYDAAFAEVNNLN